MSDEKDEGGGVVLGGISFGVGGTPTEVARDTEVKQDSRAVVQQGPVELGDALLPLRVIAVADLMPRGEFNAGANAPETATRVDPGAFDELFQRLAPRIAIEVESVLADSRKVRVDLSPNSMKSFRPDQLVKDVPLLRSLMDGRRVLERLRDGSVQVDDAASELNRLWNNSPFVSRVLGGVEVKAAPAAPMAAPTDTGASEGDVARILDMVDTGISSSSSEPVPAAAPAPAASKSEGKFGAVIAAIAHSGKNRAGARPDQGIALIEKAVGLQLGVILQHAEVRRLEEAWRGVAFLAARTPKEAVTLSVLSARLDDTPGALDKAINAGHGIEPPVTFAVVDSVCDGDAASLAHLRAIADVGEANACPIITNASSGMFGRHLDEVDRLDNKQALYDAPERAPWRAESNRPAMLWTALTINRVLARNAYDKRTSRIREATVVEQPSDEASAAVWVQPCWAVASLVMKSFDKTGWPCRITGAPDAGVIEDLPVRELELAHSGEKIAVPTEVFFSTETQKALGRLGLVALASQPNDDKAYLMRATTAYVPPPKRTQSYDTAEEQVRYPATPLADQLFVARLAQYLQALGSRIGASNTSTDVQKVLDAAVRELFEIAPPPGPELNVDVRERDGGLVATVTVRPRRFLGVGMEEITLGVPLA